VTARITSNGQQLARTMKGEWQVERVPLFYTGIHVAHTVLMVHQNEVILARYHEKAIEAFILPPRRGNGIAASCGTYKWAIGSGRLR
jgi:histidine triad (HIT) family protein